MQALENPLLKVPQRGRFFAGVPAYGVAEQGIFTAMRARRSRSQHARRWERGRPARNANRARKKPTPLSLKVPPARRGNPTGAVPLAKRKEGATIVSCELVGQLALTKQNHLRDYKVDQQSCRVYQCGDEWRGHNRRVDIEALCQKGQCSTDCGRQGDDEHLAYPYG
jgi:hypothetical protein